RISLERQGMDDLFADTYQGSVVHACTDSPLLLTGAVEGESLRPIRNTNDATPLADRRSNMTQNPTVQDRDPSISRQRCVTFLGAAFGIFVTVLNVAGQDNAGTDFRKQAAAEYRLGHYPQAERLLNLVLEAAQQTSNDDDIALIYSALANTYQEEMRFQE